MIKLLKISQTGLKSIWSNKLRSVLTIVGILIGIASVTTMVSIGESAKTLITSSLDSTFGSTTIFIQPGSDEENNMFAITAFFKDLSDKDYESIQNIDNPHIKAVSKRTMQIGEAKYRNKNLNVILPIISYTWFDTINYQLIDGRFFNLNDETYSRKVVIIDMVVKNEFFKLQNPINQEIIIDNQNFTIIGVADWEQNTLMSLGGDNAGIFILYSTYEETFNEEASVAAIAVKIDDIKNIESVKRDLKRTLRYSRNIPNGEKDDFVLQTQEDFQETSDLITDTIQIFISVIASISLLVGGIGVMNIMLVSVKERIKEIGLRKAVGATNINILLQILFESIIFSLVGGVLGLFLGSISAIVIEYIADLPIVLQLLDLYLSQ